MIKFELIDGDMDYRVYEHVIDGRMTKLRYKIINRYARKRNWRGHCGHEWDCCGCMYAQGMDLEYKDNKWVLYKTESFNY
jgi:hypothetical protein